MTFSIKNARTTFFASKEEYLEYIASWKASTQEKNLTAEDFLVHAMLLGKDLYRAFSPRKNAAAQGLLPYSTLANLVYWSARSITHTGPETPHSRLNAYLSKTRNELRQNFDVIAKGEMADVDAQVAQ